MRGFVVAGIGDRGYSDTGQKMVETSPPPATDRAISASLLRLRLRNPFMAALALFARYEVTGAVPTAATDGRTVFVNPDFWAGLTSPEQDGLLLHEVLHCALGHCWRRGARDPQVWNIAADIVINGIILEDPAAALPKGGMRDLRLEKFGSEEVYELLQRDFAKLPPLAMSDLLTAAPGEDPGDPRDSETGLDGLRRTALAGHWRHALEQAAVLSRAQRGEIPGALRRELDALDPARLDWRAVLWRYLVQTPCDFAGFDRRHLSRGLYLEQLEGESVHVFVCVDTSGSVNDTQMRSLLGEVHGVLRSYPLLTAQLWFADAKAHGPFELHAGSEIPVPVGGGGTDFRPFFAAVSEARRASPHERALSIYLTDGHGVFPEAAPEFDTLWVVTAGGLALEKFPFGTAVRLVE
jgi:predicted metal-dependent peptidase